VPNAMDLLKNDEDRALFRLMLIPQEFGRPFAAPAGVPADRVAALRAAFDATANDPAFAAELAKQGATVELLKGEQLEQMAKELFATPKPVVDKLKAVLGPS
jgi:tripartite-type tricarboxylate transporter receptor subunit TctC